MKKQRTKKERFVLRGDQPRTITVTLSREEVLQLANDHVDAANKMPAAFGRYIRDNRAIGQKDLATSRDAYLEMIDAHMKRARELDALVDKEG